MYADLCLYAGSLSNILLRLYRVAAVQWTFIRLLTSSKGHFHNGEADWGCHHSLYKKHFSQDLQAFGEVQDKDCTVS